MSARPAAPQGIPAAGPRAGFTLVEVLVALFIMAILAAMAFRGIDGIVRAKENSQAATGRTLRLGNGMSQFEYDVSQMVATGVADPVAFDGSTLRLTRRTSDGVQLVLWTLQGRRWQRWASPSVTQFGALQDQWMRTQQISALADTTLTVLEDVDAFQVYFCNPAAAGTVGCSWNNSQSTSTSPIGIRILLKLGEGDLMREVELPHVTTYPKKNP